MILHTSNSHATLGVCETAAGLRFTTPGYSSQNARLRPVIGMMRGLFAERGLGREPRDALTLVQFDDYAHQKVRSLAFGRPKGRAPLVGLMIDPYFHAQHGYRELRRLADTGELPTWEARADTLFWRGRGSHGHFRPDGEYVRGLREVPRIATALAMRDHPNSDIKIMGAWIQEETEEEVLAFLQRERIFSPSAPMAEHARYKFQLDIDGVANAWATFERLLSGSCVLKVGTDFEMWFYDRLHPWTHFVPVKSDASDLAAQLEWCLSHPREAREIAQAGQRFALSHTYDAALKETLEALRTCRILL